MVQISPVELVALLRGYRLRVRTGIWLRTLSSLGGEPGEAARLGIAHVDIRQVALAGLPDGTRFSGLDTTRVLELLDEICQGSYDSDCVLVYNFDLLLARLRRFERQEVWQQLYASFAHRPRGLLTALPQGAEALLPTREALLGWRADGRLAEG